MTDVEILRAVRAALQTGFHECFERGRREFRRRMRPPREQPHAQNPAQPHERVQALEPVPPEGQVSPPEPVPPEGQVSPPEPAPPEGQDSPSQPAPLQGQDSPPRPAPEPALVPAPDVALRPNPVARTVLSPRDWQQIGRQVLVLHEGYTRGGTEFAQASNPIHANLPGYQFYFLPRNFHRVFGVLKALPWARDQGAAPLEPWLGGAGGRATLRVLDLGCGSGAFSLAVLAWLARTVVDLRRMPEVELVLVDQSRALLELAQANVQALWRQLAPETALSVQVVANGVEQYLVGQHSAGPFAIAGAAMMLNEINLRAPRRSGKRASHFSEPFKRLLAPQGLGLLVEPGTRKGYLNLMLVREQIAGLPILYPCPHSKPCPMWSPKVDRWCHATLNIGSDFFFDEPLKRHGGLTFTMRDVNVFALAFQQPRQPAAGAAGTKRVRREPGLPVDAPRVQPPFAQRSGERVVSGLIPPPKSKPTRKARAAAAAEPSAATLPAPRSVLLCTRAGTLLELPVSGELEQRRPHRGKWLEGLSLPSSEPRTTHTSSTKRKFGSRAGTRGAGSGNGGAKGGAKGRSKDNAGSRGKQHPAEAAKSTGRAKRRG